MLSADAVLQADDLPGERLLLIYGVVETVNFTLGMLCTIVVIFVLVRASTDSLRQYRLFLAHELFWSALLDACMFAVCGVNLLPLPCWYATRLRADGAPLLPQLPVLFAGAVAAVGKFSSLTLCFGYRSVFPLHPLGWFRRASLFAQSVRPRVLLGIFACFDGVALVCFVAPVWLRLPDPAEALSKMAAANPVLAALRAAQRPPEPSALFCYSERLEEVEYLLRLANIGVLVILCAALYGSVTLPLYIRVAYRRHHAMRMQMMFYRALMSQLWTAVALQALPCLLLTTTPLVYGRAQPRLGVLAAMLMSMHAPVNCFMIVVFVKPYRRFLFRWLRTGNGPTSLHPSYTTSLVVKTIS